MARVTIEGVSKNFGTFTALDRVSIEVADGELLGVLGPSGCGKTTLLRAIAGFEQVCDGRITIADRIVSTPSFTVPPEERRVGIVFQAYALWPHMTVAENVGYALKVARVPSVERQRKVTEAMALVGLDGFGARRPAELSGGQRQRVALARCLVMTPSLVLLDEPLANLDAHLRHSMEAEFAEFHRRTRTTMVYITHDQAEAMSLSTRIAVLDQGRLQQLATPVGLYREPANEMVARFIGEGMVLPARIGDRLDDGHCSVEIAGVPVRMRAAASQRASPRWSVCVRPRDLAIATPGAPCLSGRVVRAIYRGGETRIEAVVEALGGEVLRLDVPEVSALRAGDPCPIAILGGWIIPEPAKDGASA